MGTKKVDRLYARLMQELRNEFGITSDWLSSIESSEDYQKPDKFSVRLDAARLDGKLQAYSAIIANLDGAYADISETDDVTQDQIEYLTEMVEHLAGMDIILVRDHSALEEIKSKYGRLK